MRVERFPDRVDDSGLEVGAVAEVDRSTPAVTVFGTLLAGSRDCHKTFVETVDHQGRTLHVQVNDEMVGIGACTAEAIPFRYRLRITYESSGDLPERVSVQHLADGEVDFDSLLTL